MSIKTKNSWIMTKGRWSRNNKKQKKKNNCKQKKRKCLTIVVTLIPTENSKWIWINEWTETEIETETTATSKH